MAGSRLLTTASVYNRYVPVATGFDASVYGTVIANIDVSIAANCTNDSDAQAANNEAVKKVVGVGGSYDAYQPTAGDRPTLVTNYQNGKQVISSNGYGWYFVKKGDVTNYGNILSGLSGVTVVVVDKWTNDSSFQATMFGLRSGGTSANYFNLGPANDGAVGFYWNVGTENGNSGWSPTGAKTAGVWGVTVQRYDVANDNVKTNNNETGLVYSQTVTMAATAFDTAAETTDYQYASTIGTSNVYFTQNNLYDHRGWMGQIIVYNGILSDTNTTNIITALKTYWGIA